jgi:hypothetical protein
LDCAKERPTDAGTAVMAAIANARASMTLVNIVILLVAKPEAASVDRSRNAALYSNGGIRIFSFDRRVAGQSIDLGNFASFRTQRRDFQS